MSQLPLLSIHLRVTAVKSGNVAALPGIRLGAKRGAGEGRAYGGALSRILALRELRTAGDVCGAAIPSAGIRREPH